MLRLKQSATHDTLKGELMSVSSKFHQALTTSHDMYRAPLEACAMTFFVYLEMGLNGLAGTALLLAFVPVSRESINFRLTKSF